MRKRPSSFSTQSPLNVGKVLLNLAEFLLQVLSPLNLNLCLLSNFGTDRADVLKLDLAGPTIRKIEILPIPPLLPGEIVPFGNGVGAQRVSPERAFSFRHVLARATPGTPYRFATLSTASTRISSWSSFLS